ncbi:MAG: DinB family protein [Gemmatimonadota bacterium]|nr:DinB family protein [Gemmatimonadota bacterium]
MHPSVTPLAGIFRLNTELVLNCISDLPDDLAQQRVGGTLNSIAFLVAHLTETRHYLATLLGQPMPSPFSAAFTSARSIEQAGPLPPVALLIQYWEAIAAHLAVLVERFDTPQLSRTGPARPGSDGSALSNLAFLAQHESYHLGQIALLRRALDLPPMSYRLSSREPGRQGA